MRNKILNTHTHTIILPETLFNQKEPQCHRMADSGLHRAPERRKGFLHVQGREYWENQVKIKEPEAKQSLSYCIFSWVLSPKLILTKKKKKKKKEKLAPGRKSPLPKMTLPCYLI